jgi:hypothetical protein
MTWPWGFLEQVASMTGAKIEELKELVYANM